MNTTKNTPLNNAGVVHNEQNTINNPITTITTTEPPVHHHQPSSFLGLDWTGFHCSKMRAAAAAGVEGGEGGDNEYPNW